VVLGAKQVFRRHPAVLEDQFAGGRAAPAHLAQLGLGMEPCEILLDDEGRDTLGPALRCRLGVDQQHVGDGAVGDEHLAAVQDVVIAFAPRGGAHAAERVGSRPGLGQAERADPLPCAQFRQVALLLRRCTVAQDVVEAEVLVRTPDTGGIRVPVAEGLGDERRAEQVESRPAVLDRCRDADEAVAS